MMDECEEFKSGEISTDKNGTKIIWWELHCKECNLYSGNWYALDEAVDKRCSFCKKEMTVE